MVLQSTFHPKFIVGYGAWHSLKYLPSLPFRYKTYLPHHEKELCLENENPTFATMHVVILSITVHRGEQGVNVQLHSSSSSLGSVEVSNGKPTLLYLLKQFILFLPLRERSNHLQINIIYLNAHEESCAHLL